MNNDTFLRLNIYDVTICLRKSTENYGNWRVRYEKALRYGRQPICIPCGNADPGDHSGPTALRGINILIQSVVEAPFTSAYMSRLTGNKTLPPISTVNCVHFF